MRLSRGNHGWRLDVQAPSLSQSTGGSPPLSLPRPHSCKLETSASSLLSPFQRRSLSVPRFPRNKTSQLSTFLLVLLSPPETKQSKTKHKNAKDGLEKLRAPESGAPGWKSCSAICQRPWPSLSLSFFMSERRVPYLQDWVVSRINLGAAGKG